jgi:hypothetical protein
MTNDILQPRRLIVNSLTRRFVMTKEKKQEDKMDMQAMMDVYTKLGTPSAPAVYLDFWTSAYQAIDD